MRKFNTIQAYPAQTDIFIVTHGRDCDGYHSPQMDAFKSQRCADVAIESLNKGSDGLRYVQVNRQDALRYASDHDRKLPTFFSDEYYQS